MLPDREVCCCHAAPPPSPGCARHGDLPGPGQQGERTLPGESSVKKHQKWTSARLRVHTSEPGCSSASRPDLRGRRRSWRWWWPRRPRPRGPSHPHSRHPRPYLKHSVLKGGVYEQRWWSGSHERDFVFCTRLVRIEPQYVAIPCRRRLVQAGTWGDTEDTFVIGVVYPPQPPAHFQSVRAIGYCGEGRCSAVRKVEHTQLY